jgi:hypothetical protein
MHCDLINLVVGTLMVTDFKWSAASVESKNVEKNKISFLFHAELLSGCCGSQNLKSTLGLAEKMDIHKFSYRGNILHLHKPDNA